MIHEKNHKNNKTHQKTSKNNIANSPNSTEIICLGRTEAVKSLGTAQCDFSLRNPRLVQFSSFQPEFKIQRCRVCSLVCHFWLCTLGPKFPCDVNFDYARPCKMRVTFGSCWKVTESVLLPAPGTIFQPTGSYWYSPSFLAKRWRAWIRRDMWWTWRMLKARDCVLVKRDYDFAWLALYSGPLQKNQDVFQRYSMLMSRQCFLLLSLGNQ